MVSGDGVATVGVLNDVYPAGTLQIVPFMNATSTIYT